MRVLGIGDHVSCGTALVEDGRVVAAVNDERLVREKMVFGIPRESIRLVLDMTGLSPEDIDLVAVGTRNQHLVPDYLDFREGWFGLKRGPFKRILLDVGSHAARFRDTLPWIENVYYELRRPAFAHRRRALRRVFAEEFNLQAPVLFVDHHRAHACSAYYSSGFGADATVLTLDGGGDGVSAKAFSVDGGRLCELAAVPSFASLGNFYSYITQICGFKAGRHEGKITGLAAHGDPVFQALFDSQLTFRDGMFANDGNIFFQSAVETLTRLLPADLSREDLAASVQVHSEQLATKFASHWIARTGHRDLAVAGGVVANVRINQRLHELPEVRRCFVHPGMTDAGIPVGAALCAYHENNQELPLETACLETVYLGPAYRENEIEKVLHAEGYEYQRPTNLAFEVASLLADGAVVARFDGRMEYGPRALGNRSILYQATDPSVNVWLNEALHRTEFMPFAPSTLEEESSRCYSDLDGAERTARFMTMTFDCTNYMKEACPGVVHLDGTARPHIVRKVDNPSYHAILVEYRAITGLPSIINTSFNMHEEPIVCSPSDAVRAFRLGHLDYLAIGPFLVRNPAPIRSERRAPRG